MLQQVRVGFAESNHQLLTQTSTFLWIICAGVMHSYPRDSIAIIVHAPEQ